jgi:hypothetical protein
LFSHQVKKKIDQDQEVIAGENQDIIIKGNLLLYKSKQYNLVNHLHIHHIHIQVVVQVQAQLQDHQILHHQSAIHIAIIILKKLKN